ncbi:aminopeptidase N [Chthonomonas calidirosea]|uniref:Aminopeptidase N n=1 Tax=Chthonomonas calidirosea (strain DSM 23976 / ICMP 18418 / T49) TaxID=1303518 RepID=S0EYE6_CHTCT|nr:M1 family aminopeptidase [Chthonomonas calidirosea]CCW34852.1 Aminopeptidase N [Chthonomonas calidirosea T49]CEK13609.1 aminopeptidase N [Chthonomonas calidirosea]
MQPIRHLIARYGEKIRGAQPFAPLLIVALCLQLASRTCAAPTSQWITFVQRAIQTHQIAFLQAYTDGSPAKILPWLNRGPTRTWNVQLLTLPNRQSMPSFIVFSCWHTCQSDGDHVHALIETPQGWKIGPEVKEDDSGGYQICNHQLTVRLQPKTHSVLFSDRASVQAIFPKPRPYCLFRLSPDYTITRFSIEGMPVPFHRAGSVVAFIPPHMPPFTMDIAYAGAPDHQDGDYVLPNEAVIDSYWYPQIARLPATSTVQVTAPPAWTPISTGDLQSTIHHPDGSTTLTFYNPIPVCYLTVDMGRYHVYTRTVQGLRLAVYLLDDDASLAQRALNLLQQVLFFYSDHFAPFPYHQYTVVETDGPFDGALEAYSFATFEHGTLLDLLPHELAHTWWGGLQPCTYLHSMWDEAFADYSALLFQRIGGPQAVTLPNDTSLQTTGEERFQMYPVASVFDTTDPVQCDIGYTKGSMVLRVLEEELGLPTMLACLRAFLAERTAGKPAEWSDFQRAVNRITGRNYAVFFQEWLYRAGLPVLQLQDVRLLSRADGYEVTGYIVQKDPIYHLHLPVQLTMLNHDVYRKKIEIDQKSTFFILKTTVKPQYMVIDPDHMIPLATHQDTFWRF